MILTEENRSPKTKVSPSFTLSITYSTAVPEIKPGIVQSEAKTIFNLLKYKKSRFKPIKFIKLFKLGYCFIPPIYAVKMLSLLRVRVSSTTDTTSLNLHNIMTNFVVNIKTTNKQTKGKGMWFLVF